jgi:nucleoside-diphosphate-sugar epimerase
MTSGPTLAMEAAARGEGFAIGYGGTAQYDYAHDVGEAFARAARAATDGAHVVNFPGVAAPMEEVVAAIVTAAPKVEGKITWAEEPLPFPALLESGKLERLVGELPRTPLIEGVRRTVEHFRGHAGSGPAL